jgi:hypothetical protein
MMNRSRGDEESFTGKNDFATLKAVGKVLGLAKDSIAGSQLRRYL